MSVARPVALHRQQLRFIIDIAYFVQIGILGAVPLQRSGVTAASAPSAVGFPLRGNRLGRCPKPQQNFDKGFGDFAAVAWYGGMWARHWFQRQSLYQNGWFRHKVLGFTKYRECSIYYVDYSGYINKALPVKVQPC